MPDRTDSMPRAGAVEGPPGDSTAGYGVGRRYRSATWGLVVVLSSVAGFSLWSSQYSARLTARAVEQSTMSDAFTDAARAVADARTLEQRYRLEPAPDVRVRFGQASQYLVVTLERIRLRGTPADQRLVGQVLALQGPFRSSISKMFDAVDDGVMTAVQQIDDAETDPLVDQIEDIVGDEAQARHEQSVDSLERLGRMQRFTGIATPAVFFIGLLMALWFASVLRRVRRQLRDEGQRAWHSSLHDSLTGLANRVLLADRLDQALRTGKRDHRPTALLLVDLDRFKDVNDTLGHHYGDELLKQVGARLASGLRDMDTVARLGGDEFAVLLPNVEGLAGAIAAAERLRASLATPFVIDDVELAVDASVGIVVSGLHGEDPGTLLQRADVAMYVAKDQGIGVFAYDPGHDGHSPERLSLLSELRHAIDHGQLVLDYQPQVSLTTGEMTGVEALVRWNHPTRGLVSPDSFIPLAEHTAMIGPLTATILDLAVGQVRRWLDGGHRIPVSVNFSARNLLEARLVDDVVASLERHAVSVELLKIEITESAIMSEPVRAQETLQRLHDLGLQISIDDFGAGYTSLAQLKDLPVSELKVDRSFVMSMDRDARDALIVHSVVELGHNLGLTVVAEGVETIEALETLGRYGCDVAQGYFLSRPIPAEMLLDWYLSNRPDHPGSGSVAPTSNGVSGP